MEGEPQLVAECDANLVAFASALARATLGGSVHEVGSSVLVRTGIATPSFNPVFALTPVADVEGLTAAVNDCLVRTETPWLLITVPSVRRGLGRMIDAFRLERRRLYPLMCLRLGPHPATPAGLQIRPATDARDLRAWQRTFETGAGVREGFLSPWIEGRLAMATASPLQLFLGTVDGVPVATSARMTTGRLAGVYIVNTLERHRRLGYGTAMTWAAADGRADGCAFSCLQASAMGAPVYAAMGYRALAEYEYWQPSDVPGPG